MFALRLFAGLQCITVLNNCTRFTKSVTLLTLKTFRNSTFVRYSSELKKPLKQWTLVVNPFGSIRVQLRCSLSVRPLDPHVFPDSNRAFITVYGTSVDQRVKLDNFHVHYDDQDKELFIFSENENGHVSVELTAPIKSDLYVSTGGDGHVRIEQMESDTCRVQTERGHCELHSLKVHQVCVQSSGGNIKGFGTIHGNVIINTSGESEVDVKKIQGTKMCVSTEHGSLKVNTIFAQFTNISSYSGAIQLGHLHGEASVKSVLGNISVDGSNGFLKVCSHSGHIDVYVGQSGSAELLSQDGSVSVRVPASIIAGVMLSGSSVEISPEMVLHDAKSNSTESRTTITGVLNQNYLQVDKWIKAETHQGYLSLKTQSWFESLKIGS